MGEALNELRRFLAFAHLWECLRVGHFAVAVRASIGHWRLLTKQRTCCVGRGA
jgi:hypothetical protein